VTRHRERGLAARPEPATPAAQAPVQRESRWPALRNIAILYAAVATGTVVGGVLRALVSLAFAAVAGAGFPWGTLFANVTGSFAIGFYATLAGPDGRLLAGTRQRQFIMAGICGGYTTFSMFSLETLRLAQAGELSAAALNVGLSTAGWLAAVWLGHVLAMRLNRLKGA
jgi:CrcB protein